MDKEHVLVIAWLWVKLNVNGYLNKSVVLQMYLYTKSADRLSQLLTLST